MTAPFAAAPSGSTDERPVGARVDGRGTSKGLHSSISRVMRPVRNLVQKLASTPVKREERPQVTNENDQPKAEETKRARRKRAKEEPPEADGAVHAALPPASSFRPPAAVPPILRAAHLELPAAFFADEEEEEEEFVDVGQPPAVLQPHTFAAPADFVCEWESCDHRFHDEVAFQRHGLEHLASSSTSNCCWRSCEEKLGCVYTMKKHVRSVHLRIRPFRCPECGNSFTRKDNFDVHMSGHKNERKAKCDFPGCVSSFFSNSDLKKHQKSTHYSKKDYKCPVVSCTSAYTTTSSLRKHMNTAHGDGVWEEAKRLRKASGQSFNYGQIDLGDAENKPVRQSNRHRARSGDYVVAAPYPPPIERQRHRSANATGAADGKPAAVAPPRSRSMPAKSRGRTVETNEVVTRLNPVFEVQAEGDGPIGSAPYMPQVDAFADYTAAFHSPLQPLQPFGGHFHSDPRKLGPQLETQEQSGETDEPIDVVNASPQKPPSATFGALPPLGFAFNAPQPSAYFPPPQHAHLYGAHASNDFIPQVQRYFQNEMNEFADLSNRYASGPSFNQPLPSVFHPTYQPPYMYQHDHMNDLYR